MVQRSKEGDAAAFARLARDYQRMVFGLAFGHLRNFQEAQDVAQEVFTKAYQSLGTLRKPEAFSAWLRRMTLNQSRMRLRALGRSREDGEVLILEREASQAGDPSIALEKRELDPGIAAVFGRLSESLRLPAVLCYLDGMKPREAARLLGIKAGTMRKRLHDAKRKLQRGIVAHLKGRFEEHRLPRDFARRCICGCEEALPRQKGKRKGGGGDGEG